MFLVKEDSELVPEIQGFKKKLYPYQLASIKTLEILETQKINASSMTSGVQVIIKTNIGIFANSVGSGKTLVLLGLISRDTHKNKLENYEGEDYNVNTGSHNIGFRKNSISTILKFPGEITRDRVRQNIVNATLIVCPGNVLKQWENELSETNINYLVIKTAKQASDIKLPDVKNVMVVLCSNTMYNNIVNSASRIMPNNEDGFINSISNDIIWNRIIFDEADSIKSINNYFTSRFYWLVTATSSNFKRYKKNNFIDKLLLTIPTDKEHYVTVTCCAEFIAKTVKFKRTEFFIECCTPFFLNVLGRHLSEEVTNLINAGEIEDAVKKMGGDVTSGKDVIKTFQETTRNEIKDCVQLIKYTETLRNISETERKKRIELASKKIESCKVQLESVEEKIKELSEGTCIVCFSEYENPLMIKCCKNILCFDCMSQCLKNSQTCPYCRKPLNFTNTVLISDQIKPSSEQNEEMKNKKNTCVDIINKNPGKKILVFSQYKFNEIKPVLDSKDIPYKELEGGRDIVERLLKKYKKPNGINILLLNSGNMGAGVNLENTDIIIFYNKMGVNERTQVIGRALRASRKTNHELSIYNLCHKNEMPN